MEPCYTGPAGTEGVGACKAGMHACNSTGMGYGPCVGQVLPKPEVCSTPEDDDCNGQANEVCICEPFSTVPCYTGPAGTEGVGQCQGGTMTCDFTGKAYGPCLDEIKPQVDNCVTPIDEDCDGSTPPCTGTTVFGKLLGGAQDEEGLAVAADTDGNVIVGGYTIGAVDFGCGTLPGGAAEGAAVVKLSASGTCLWSKRFGDGSRVTGVGTDIGGNIYLTGSFTGSLDLGGGPLTSAGQSDVFFAKLDAAGALLWAKRFGDGAPQTAMGLAVDPANNAIGVGYFQGAIDFGGGALTSAGGNDIYVVKLDTAGTFVWARSFGDGGNQVGNAVAVDEAYNAVITGSFSGTVDFGGGPLTSAGLGDAFVARFDSTGSHVWSARWGDAKDQAGYAVAAFGAGQVYVAGTFDGTIDLGGATYTTMGGQDGWLVALDPAGAYRWSRQIGGVNTQVGACLGVDRFGNVGLGVTLSGAADLGTGLLTSAGTSDVAVAKYDPSGLPLWSHRYGDAAAQIPKGIAFTPSGAMALTGIFVGTSDFGAGPVSGGGGEDLGVVVLSP
ncbi:MAG: nucleotide-binding protein [Minicystis sp.]